MKNQYEDLAVRLIEERGRLGYSQADFANKTGISREGLRLYETGKRGLGAEFLLSAAALGLDVQYVFSGVRSTNAPSAQQTLVSRQEQPAVSIGGANTNVIGMVQPGATVQQIHTQRHVTKTIAKVDPGATHITDEQAAVIQRLVGEVVERESQLKKNPKTHRAVWSTLNAHCGVPQYRLIQLDDFDKAKKYLLQWMGRLNSMASAPATDTDAWRLRRYRYIKANQTGIEDAVLTYMKKNFSASSLTELSEDQLDRVYRYVAGKKK